MQRLDRGNHPSLLVLLWIISILLSVRERQTASGKDEKMKCGKCHGRFLRGGAFSRERTGIIVFCIVRTFASTVLFAQFSLFRTLVLVFHCITIYNSPPSQGHPIHMDPQHLTLQSKRGKCLSQTRHQTGQLLWHRFAMTLCSYEYVYVFHV